MKRPLLSLLLAIICLNAAAQDFILPLRLSDNTTLNFKAFKHGKDFYLEVPGLTPTSLFPIDSTGAKPDRGILANRYLARLNSLYAAIVKLCPAAETVNYGNITQFFAYFPSDAAAFLLRSAVAHPVKSFALGSCCALELDQSQEGYYIISETFAMPSVSAREILKLERPAGPYTMKEATIQNNSPLLDSLGLLADLLLQVDAKIRPSLFLWQSAPDFRLLLYCNETNSAQSVAVLVPHAVGEKFKGAETWLPIGAAAPVQVFALKPNSSFNHP